jgi:small subunit ribosomal protein S6
MNTYELMLIVNPQISDTEVAEVIEKSKKMLADEKAEIVAEDKLGRRKFAHEVKKNRDGFYIYLKMKAGAATLKNVKRLLGLQEHVLRSMVIKAAAEPLKKA